MSQANKDLVRRIFDETWGLGPCVTPGTFAAGLLLLVLGVGQALAATNNCSASGATTGGPPPQKHLICAGSCPDLSTCQSHVQDGIPSGRGEFPPTHPYFPNKTFAWCACPNEGITACCKLVGVLNDDEDKITDFEEYGDCVSCPTFGLCVAVYHNGQWQAACL